MEVLSLLEYVQVVLVSDEDFMRSVECPYAAGVDFVGVSDVDAVEVEAEQQSDADVAQWELCAPEGVVPFEADLERAFVYGHHAEWSGFREGGASDACQFASHGVGRGAGAEA